MRKTLANCTAEERDFMRTPDQFRTNLQKTDYEKTGKTGEMSKPRGETKLKKVIKPQK